MVAGPPSLKNSPFPRCPRFLPFGYDGPLGERDDWWPLPGSQDAGNASLPVALGAGGAGGHLGRAVRGQMDGAPHLYA